MLEQALKDQLAAYLERVTQPFEMVASLDDSETSADMRSLLETIQSLRADKISLRLDGNDARKPSFSLQRVGSDTSLRFAGLPLGHEFTSLVLALLWTGGHPPKGGAGCDRPDQGPGRRLQLRGLHEPLLPQLPGRGAGALAHGHQQPQDQDHRH
jgi:alkyl hydroperoxide reductase subunit AhpF